MQKTRRQYRIRPSVTFHLFFGLYLLVHFGEARVFGQQAGSYQAQMFIKQNDSMAYRLAKPTKPAKATSAVEHPLLIFLHGSGERGNDNLAQLIHGGNRMARLAEEQNAYVLMPQCPAHESWHNGKATVKSNQRRYAYPKSSDPNEQLDMVFALIEDFVQRHPVDLNRLYIGGLSMGAMGTLELLRQHPDYFAGAFAICGGAHPKTSKALKSTPLWLFHGLDDKVVLPQYSIKLYKKLKRKGADVQLTTYPKVGHDSWHQSFAEPTLFPWLFAQRNGQ